MTEAQIRKIVVDAAEAYLGCNEKDGSHKKIIDIYNTQKPLPRGYAVKYTDNWCATFVSAMGVQLGMSDTILPECSCNEMIKLYKAAGRWEERDDYTPKPADIVMFDWQDDGKGDNTGGADHTGIIARTVGDTLYIIEGNKNDAVEYRLVEVNGKNIRGYCLPDFASLATKEEPKQKVCALELPVLKKGDKNATVKAMQILLIGYGYKMQNKGKTYGADGSFGAATENALKAFQKDNDLEDDGVCGPKTWAKLLGVTK